MSEEEEFTEEFCPHCGKDINRVPHPQEIHIYLYAEDKISLGSIRQTFLKTKEKDQIEEIMELVEEFFPFSVHKTEKVENKQEEDRGLQEE